MHRKQHYNFALQLYGQSVLKSLNTQSTICKNELECNVIIDGCDVLAGICKLKTRLV